MKLKGINLPSPDPMRLAAFYRSVLGAEVDDSHGGPNRVEIWFGARDDDTVYIVATRAEGFTPQNFGACQGFEFYVADAEAECKRIVALGIEVKTPPQNVPWGFRFFNIRDPDGNGIDIVQKL